MYLGEGEIKKTMEDGEMVEVTFADDKVIRINKELFEMIQTDKKVNQPYQYLINSALATKFLEQMAKYNLEYKYVSSVAQSMITLAFNIRDEKVAKKFFVEHPDEISLKDIMGYETK